jgi:hypothetical protein
MHISTIIEQHRRDFTAIFQCEHCGAKAKKSGYDDANFHDNVIPAMPCGTCQKVADKERYRPLATLYPAGKVV